MNKITDYIVIGLGIVGILLGIIVQSIPIVCIVFGFIVIAAIVRLILGYNEAYLIDSLLRVSDEYANGKFENRIVHIKQAHADHTHGRSASLAHILFIKPDTFTMAGH